MMVVCFLCLASDVSARRFRSSRRNFGPSKRKINHVFFKGAKLDAVTRAPKHTSEVLECTAGGMPGPTIHWLKNGERMEQGSVHEFHDDSAYFEDHTVTGGQKFLRLGQTVSRLYLDCLTHKDEAEYTCVAETPFNRKTQKTMLKVEKTEESIFADMDRCMSRRAHRVTPARIYMASTSRLEFQGATVQLFCRAEGSPAPTITWRGPWGKTLENDGENYVIRDNGDLIIKNLSWKEHMGLFKCEVTNGYGHDSAKAFVYPTLRAKNSKDEFLFSPA